MATSHPGPEPLLKSFVCLLRVESIYGKGDITKSIPFVIKHLGHRERDIGRSVITLVIIIIDTDYLKHAVATTYIFAHRRFLAEQHLRHTGTQHDHFAAFPHVLLIDEATVLRIDIHIADLRIVGRDTIGLACQIFPIIADRITMRD